ncbi:MAG: hypothetical protein H7Y36_11665 [Armatimonadetes bacterium]|nr:hypothetical protein [Akkermansiaceae bacterium]
MSQTLTLKPTIAFGVVPTHIKFVGGLVPDADGNFPREGDGRLSIVAEMERICRQSPVRPTCTQIPFFAGANEEDIEELISGLKALDLAVHLIMMVGGANPMNPADEDAVVSQLVTSLTAAQKHGVVSVSSTSIEEWMKAGETRRDGADFNAAVAQNVKVHVRAAKESGLTESSIAAWHIEFLRPGEFKTFTDLNRAWTFVKAANKALGKNYFKLLIDAAHCGDSGLSIEENQKLIADIAAADHMGIYHASSKTTRGCLSTDDGWIGATLHAAAKTGKLETVFVELFHHEDPALEGLRNMDSGHGIDTRDGRSYTQTTIDGLVETAHRLNNLQARGIL